MTVITLHIQLLVQGSVNFDPNNGTEVIYILGFEQKNEVYQHTR